MSEWPPRDQSAPEPLVRIRTKGRAAPATVPLFQIDDEPWFEILDPVPASYVMGVIRDLRTMPYEVVIASLIDRVLGAAAVDRLAKCDKMTREEAQQILDIVRDRVMGAMSLLDGITGPDGQGN